MHENFYSYSILQEQVTVHAMISCPICTCTRITAFFYLKFCGGIMLWYCRCQPSVASSVVNCGFEPQLGQIEVYLNWYLLLLCLALCPLGLFKFISDYLPYFEQINLFFNIIAKKV
jgi:hypothetical protein